MALLLNLIGLFLLVLLPQKEDSRAAKPEARHHHAMAYDEKRGNLILFSGNGDDVPFFSDPGNGTEKSGAGIAQQNLNPEAVMLWFMISRIP